MPKVAPQFDADGLIHEVYKQDLGLRCTTNNPRLWKATVYKHARRLGLPVHIYSYPRRPNSFAVMKQRAAFDAGGSDG